MCVGKRALTIAVLVLIPAACSGDTARPTPTAATATILDVSYAHQSSAERLDLYLPARSGRAPLVMWMHGGAFSVGDKSSITADESGPAPTPSSSMGPYQIQHPHVDDLLARGYAVASLDYRMEGPVQGAPDAVRDAKAAVRFLRASAARYRLDPDRFAVWGNSAGAYMAVMLGVTGDRSTVYDDPAMGNGSVSSAVQAVVDWYGPMALPDNPIAHIATARSLPPFLIAQGAADQAVDPADAQDLQAALVRVGARSTLTMIPGAGHEDHAFSATQLPNTYAFLDRAFGRSTG
jgi:acetyl esterase/lipase